VRFGGAMAIDFQAEAMMHKIDIPSEIIARVTAMRGGLHMFEDIEPGKTAHIIIDLQNGFMAEGQPVEIPTAREIVPNVNRISAAVRAAGGLNVFIQYLVDDVTRAEWSTKFTAFARPERNQATQDTFAEGSYGYALWPELEVRPEDLIVPKRRFGAFVPGSSQLDEILRARGIDTLIITGTATNVCCESTARDAMQMNYKVIFIADGNAAKTDAEHNATLGNMASLFADVMTTDEVVACLKGAGATQAAAE
jgi:ureidoacrylate peracid hydrolase